MLTAPSYGKVNLFLYVTAKRPDGYHEISTLFCAIDFYDTIKINPAKKTFLENTGIGIPVGKDNIVMAVDEILRKEYKLQEHYKISIHKRIPVGAGLAGGSSNACTYLELVDKASKLNLSLQQKHSILERVGSDAAFFLYKPFAVGSGRGEILTPVNVSTRLHFILINPGIFISAASAYKDEKLQLTTSGDLPKILNLYGMDDILAVMKNDLQLPIFLKYPVLSEICDSIEASGAVKAMMSGSGSTIFGIFTDSDIRDTAYVKLQQKYDKYLIIKADSVLQN